jgi:hypothetical protein
VIEEAEPGANDGLHRQAEEHVADGEGELEVLAEEADLDRAVVLGELLAHQLLDVAEDLRVGRVEGVRPVLVGVLADLHAAGQAPDVVGQLDDGDGLSLLGQAQPRRQTGAATAQDHHWPLRGDLGGPTHGSPAPR